MKCANCGRKSGMSVCVTLPTKGRSRCLLWRVLDGVEVLKVLGKNVTGRGDGQNGIDQTSFLHIFRTVSPTSAMERPR